MTRQTPSPRPAARDRTSSSPRSRSLPPGRVLQVAALATYVVALALPGDPVGIVVRDVVLANLAYGGSLLALLVVGRASRHDRPWRWALAAAILSWMTGNLLFVLQTPPLGTDPAPFWAGVGYLGFYPLCILAVALSVRRTLGRMRLPVLLDGATSGLAAAAALLLAALPVAGAFSGGDLETVATLGPLVGDVAAIAMVAGVMAMTGGRADPHHYVLALGLLVFVTADASYAIRFATDTYTLGTPFDALWPLGLAVMAAGAWHPSRTGAPRLRVGLSSLWTVGVSSLVSVAVLVASSRLSLPWVVVALATASLLCAAGRVVIAFGQVRDLTTARLQALTDELTGLPNRRRFVARMAEVLAGSERAATGTRRGRPLPPEHQHGLLLLDLDGFKEINDRLGHARGDLLLKQVADRLTAALRPGDLVARLGGDEFAVVLEGAGDEHRLQRIADHLLAEIARPVDLGAGPTSISGSIGVVPFSTGSSEQLIGNADLAMYDAKQRGRNRSVSFTPDLRHAAEARLSVQHDLREALLHGGLEPWFQPVVDLRTGTWVGAEALCRWSHPTRGMVSPVEFIPVAEEVGLIARVDETVRALALPQVGTWKRMLGSAHEFCVGLNVSAQDLSDPDLVDSLLAGCRDAGLAPDAIVLEVTESSLGGRGRAERRRLADLRSTGMQIAIDDFGTGYSSLSYLADLPADVLKLDRSFVAALGSSRRTESVVRAAVTLAQDLDMVLLAEGIETAEQHERLLDLGCTLGQGFLLQRPVPVAEFTGLMPAPLPQLAPAARAG